MCWLRRFSCVPPSLRPAVTLHVAPLVVAFYKNTEICMQTALRLWLSSIALPTIAMAALAQAANASPSTSGEESSGDAQQMSKIKVEGEEMSDGSTEGLGYGATSTTIGKDVRSLRELPHSVTIVTRQQLTDQNITSIEGALKNVTGLTVQRFDAAGNYNSFIARGYAADAYQLDGLTLQTDTNGIYFDLAAYDRIEVQRGAAGLFSGAGEPGVTVNIARKRAPAAFQADTALSIGSWDDRRLEVDLGNALNDSGSLRGRAVGVLQSFDTFMDGIDGNKRRMLYGTLENDLGEHTTITIGGTWQSVDTVLSRGLPTWPDARLIDMPRSTMPVMDWNYQQLDSTSAFAEMEHRGTDDSLLKVALRHLSRRNEAAYTDPSIPAADGVMSAMTASAFQREDVDNSFDLYYSKPLTWGGRTHNVLFGADYRRSDNETNYSPYSIPLSGSVNLFDVDHRALAQPDFDLSVNVSDTEVTSYGTYAQLRYEIASAWTLIGGGRLSWWESEQVSNGVASSYDASSEFTPYFATLVDLTPTISAYGSYNEIFKAQNARTVSGEQIEPRVGRQVELGLKGEAAGGALLYTTAVYRLIDENRAIDDPGNDGFSLAAGKARAQGFEAEIRGEITPQWSVTAGYAFTETKYLRSTPEQQGQTLSSVTPKHNGNLWVHHMVSERLLKGVELSAGMRSVSDFFSGTGTQMVRAPGYTLFSMGGSYQISERYRLSFNVDNLFDKKYWEKVSSPSRQNFFGEPRRFTLSLRASM